MSRPALAVLTAVLLLAPVFAALPDDTTLPQTVWASLLSALVMGGVIATAAQSWRAARRGGTQEPRTPSQPALTAFMTVLGLALLSCLARLGTQRGPAYLDLMLHGWAVLATEFALFVLCRGLARASRSAPYIIVLAAVIGSAVVSSQGVNEYLLHFVAHEASWRVFATSTPDFLAGYLVLMLPITLALFLGAPAEKRLPLLFGLVIVLQMATLLTTGSRFALVSLILAFVVFAGALAYSVRRGLPLDPALRRRIAGIAAVVVLAGLAAAGPILHRLHSGASQENSGAFRLWTWRGAARMAAANPILGTGTGTWIDTYPRYALTGFTRLAHNAYLQMADECGLPAVLALAATLGFVAAAGTRGLKRPLAAPLEPPADTPVPMPKAAKRGGSKRPPAVTEAPANGFLAALAPTDDRLLLCGLLGSLAAGVIQNFIDSDWYVFFIGVTFWALAGLTVGLAETAAPVAGPGSAGDAVAGPRRRSRPFAAPMLASGAGILVLLFVSQGGAARLGYLAQTADDPGAARDYYSAARLWNPLSARYPAELGARIEARIGSAVAAEGLLRAAIRLEPSGTNFRRLGTILDGAGRNSDAAEAYRDGLRVDPNSLDMLLALAKDSPPPQALDVYRRITALEDSPVGRVRAIGEITEARFAFADAALGDAAAGSGETGEAVRSYVRAQRLLEAYLEEGGTENGERQVQSGNHPDPAADMQFRDLYARVMGGLGSLSPADRKAAAQDRAQGNLLRFQAVIDTARGDTAATPTEAIASYQSAAAETEDYVSQAQRDGTSGDSKAAAQMSVLYKHVLESLTALTPTDQQAAVLAREQAGLRKFAETFHTP